MRIPRNIGGVPRAMRPANRHSVTTRPGPARAGSPTSLRPRAPRAGALPGPSCLRRPGNESRRRESARPRDRNARRGRRSARLPVRRTRSGRASARRQEPNVRRGRRSSRPPVRSVRPGRRSSRPPAPNVRPGRRSSHPPVRSGRRGRRSSRPPVRSARRPRQNAHPPAPVVLRRPRAAARPAERRRHCVVEPGPRADQSAPSRAAQDPAPWRGSHRQPCPRRRRPPLRASRSTRAPRER